ncbi:MAG: hypothetical protein WA705_31405 [Candidatus Ozemobacteraceae bacterium]
MTGNTRSRASCRFITFLCVAGRSVTCFRVAALLSILLLFFSSGSVFSESARCASPAISLEKSSSGEQPLEVFLDPKPWTVFLRGISFDELIAHFFRVLLSRPPKIREMELLKCAFRERRLDLWNFIINLLKSREFLEKSVLPFEAADAIRNIFKKTLGRKPSVQENNKWTIREFDQNLIWVMADFVETYFEEILEHAVKRIYQERP